ncbi:MAG: 50S ribosomal protein L18 [Candidatus Saccharimonadia bacterium]
MIQEITAKDRRRARVRSRISGTKERPRLSVHVTNKHITAQLIDDTKGVTLGYVTSVKSSLKGNMTEVSKEVGKLIATEAKKHKIKYVVFDRAGRIYHGRIHALAEAARAEGLEF